MLNNNAADAATAAADMCGEEVKKTDGRPDLKRRVSSGSSDGAPRDTSSCDQPKNQAPPPSNDDATTDHITMAPHQRQALAHLYHSSRRSRNFRSVPSSPSALTYAQARDQKLLNQDEHKKDVPNVQDVLAQQEPSSTVEDVEWSFDIASLVDDDCSSVSSFDGEESFMCNDIFRVQSDCWESKNGVKNSISDTMSCDDGVQTSVAGSSSYKRLRTT